MVSIGISNDEQEDTMIKKLAAVGVTALVVGAGASAALAAGNPGAPGTGAQAGTCVPKLDGTGPGPGPNGTGSCTPKRDGTGAGAKAGYGHRAGFRVHATR